MQKNGGEEEGEIKIIFFNGNLFGFTFHLYPFYIQLIYKILKKNLEKKRINENSRP